MSEKLLKKKRSRRPSIINYPKNTLRDSVLMLLENAPQKKSTKKIPNLSSGMKFLRKFWEWLCDVEDDHDYSGWTRFVVWLQNSIKILIWLGVIIGICWLLFNLPRTVVLLSFFVILIIIGNLYYKEKRHGQHLKRKYEELLAKVNKLKNRR